MPTQWSTQYKGEPFTVYSGGRDLDPEAFKAQAMPAIVDYVQTGRQTPMTQGGFLVFPERENPQQSAQHLQQIGRMAFEEYIAPPLRAVAGAVGRTVGEDIAPFFLGSQAQKAWGEAGAGAAKSLVGTPESLALTAAGALSGLGGVQLTGKAAAGIYGTTQAALTPGILNTPGTVAQGLGEAAFAGVGTKVFNVLGAKLAGHIEKVGDAKAKAEFQRQTSDLLASYMNPANAQMFQANPRAFVERFNTLNSSILKQTQKEELAKIADTAKQNLTPQLGGEVTKSIEKITGLFNEMSAITQQTKSHPFGKPYSFQDAGALYREAETEANKVTSLLLGNPQAVPPPTAGTAHVLANDPQSRQLLIDRLRKYKNFATIEDTISPFDLERILGSNIDLLSTPGSSPVSILDSMAQSGPATSASPAAMRASLNEGLNVPRVWEGIIRDPYEYLGPIAKSRMDAQKAFQMSNPQAVSEIQALNIQNFTQNLKKMYESGIEQKMIGTVLKGIAEGGDFDASMAKAIKMSQMANASLDKLSQDITAKGMMQIAQTPPVSPSGGGGFDLSTLGGAVVKAATGGGGFTQRMTRAGWELAKGGLRKFNPLERPTYPASQVINPGALAIIRQELFGPTRPLTGTLTQKRSTD